MLRTEKDLPSGATGCLREANEYSIGMLNDLRCQCPLAKLLGIGEEYGYKSYGI